MRGVLKEQRHTIDRVFALALFCAFAASVLMVLIIGAGVYKNTVKSMEDRYTERTCLSYIASKVHHYDVSGGVYLQRFGDGQALTLEENLEGTDYITLIYAHEGYVKELFMEKGLDLSPEDGEIVIEDTGLELQQAADNLIKVSCKGEDGRNNSMYISINSCR